MLAASAIISICQPEFAYSDILFECISAIGTVGMTRGITPLLSTLPKIVIITLMFMGRITSLTFAFLIMYRSRTTSTEKPRDSLLIG